MQILQTHLMYPVMVDPSEFCFHPETKFFIDLSLNEDFSLAHLRLKIQGVSGQTYNIDFIDEIDGAFWNATGKITTKYEVECFFALNFEMKIGLTSDIDTLEIIIQSLPFHEERLTVNRYRFMPSDYFLGDIA